MKFHLLLTNIGYVFDILVPVFLIAFISLKSTWNTATKTLACLFVCVIIFETSLLIGMNVQDPELSRKILMFNLVDTLMPVFTLHCLFALFEKQREYKNAIIGLYATATAIIIFFVSNPFLFLQDSVPKMYLPNYYVPGPLYWVMLAFFFLVLVYMFLKMIQLYRVSNGIDRKRIIYFVAAMFLGYSFGSLDFLLIYNIHVDPAWGIIFVPIFAIPFTYAAVQYELMDIQLIAKKAFTYGLITIVLGLVLSGFNYLNTLISQDILGFPVWIFSLVLAFVTTAIGFFIWKKIREADVLKYEFVTIVTHKFRTPLTYIKWSTDNLSKSVPESFAADVKNIQAANTRLVELTNVLSHLSDAADSSSTEYHLESLDLFGVLQEITRDAERDAKSKNIEIHFVPAPADPAFADDQRIRFVFQTLIDNALIYTPEGGKVTVTLLQSGKNVVVNISDTGLGISKNEEKFIFSKFYRGPRAARADTEGMGIGLFLAREIMKRHNGSITVESEGEGKGASFTVTMPAARA